MIKMPRLRNLVAAATLLTCGAIQPDCTARAEGRVPADAATTGQKAQFVENLVTKSVSASRIEQSGDAAAMQSLAAARDLVSRARADLSSGNFSAANDKLDEALALVNQEVQRLSGDEVRSAHDRDVYERRLKSVQTFLSAYQRVADDGGSRAAADQAKTIRKLIDRAEAEAGNGRYSDAIAHLDNAYAAARGDIREIRDGQTLVRSLDFATAEEAYDYEVGRNQSHFLLLQFAIAEKSPAGSVVGRIEENRRKAEALRGDAERQAAAGDYGTAIDNLNASTELLLKTIRMSGMFVPG